MCMGVSSTGSGSVLGEHWEMAVHGDLLCCLCPDQLRLGTVGPRGSARPAGTA